NEIPRDSTLIGAILAGGRNVRFGGRPKGLESVGGIRVIDRVATALRVVTSELIVVSNDPDAVRWLPGLAAQRDVRSRRARRPGASVPEHQLFRGACAGRVHARRGRHALSA